MDGQHVHAVLQQADVRREIETLGDKRGGIRVLRRGGRIPSGAGGRTGLGDFDAIQIGDEAVIVVHAQGQLIKRRKFIGDDLEWHAHQRRGVHVARGGREVGADETVERTSGWHCENLNLCQRENVCFVSIADAAAAGKVRVRCATNLNLCSDDEPAGQLDQVEGQIGRAQQDVLSIQEWRGVVRRTGGAENSHRDVAEAGSTAAFTVGDDDALDSIIGAEIDGPRGGKSLACGGVGEVRCDPIHGEVRWVSAERGGLRRGLSARNVGGGTSNEDV